MPKTGREPQPYNTNALTTSSAPSSCRACRTEPTSFLRPFLTAGVFHTRNEVLHSSAERSFLTSGLWFSA